MYTKWILLAGKNIQTLVHEKYRIKKRRMFMKQNDIYIIHGTDYKDMTIRILTEAGLEQEIGSRDKHIALKPNLLGTMTPESGATTHPELVCGVIEYLQAHGFTHLTIMEGSWVGERTSRSFAALGYHAISEKYGVPLVDLQKDEGVPCNAAGMKIEVCRKALEADYIINMPVIKGHCQTLVTCALKNNKGLITNAEKRRFHTMGLHKPIAHLSTTVRNDFILVDNICGDLDFEEGGNPVVMNRILALKDPVLCDAFVCDCLGISVDEVPYIRLAEQLGTGCADISKANLILLNESSDTEYTQITGAKRSAPMSRRVKKLAGYTAPKDSCSACYGSLIHALNRLDEAGQLRPGMTPICIGQGYKGQAGEIGVGSCTSCFSNSLKGCPPKAIDIVKFLEENWEL